MCILGNEKGDIFRVQSAEYRVQLPSRWFSFPVIGVWTAFAVRRNE